MDVVDLKISKNAILEYEDGEKLSHMMDVLNDIITTSEHAINMGKSISDDASTLELSTEYIERINNFSKSLDNVEIFREFVGEPEVLDMWLDSTKNALNKVTFKADVFANYWLNFAISIKALIESRNKVVDKDGAKKCIEYLYNSNKLMLETTVELVLKGDSYRNKRFLVANLWIDISKDLYDFVEYNATTFNDIQDITTELHELIYSDDENLPKLVTLLLRIIDLILPESIENEFCKDLLDYISLPSGVHIDEFPNARMGIDDDEDDD